MADTKTTKSSTAAATKASQAARAKKRSDKAKEKIAEAIKLLNEVDKLPVNELPKYYCCVRCGKRYRLQLQEHFHSSPNSRLFDGNDGYIHVCMDCVNELYKKLYETYQDKRIAMIAICSITYHYFNDAIFEQIYYKDDFSPGKYFRRLNLVSSKNANLTFLDYLIDLYQKNGRDISDVRDEITKNWKDSEIENRRRVISDVGYEPFTDIGYSPEDLRFLYNTAATYITDDVKEDAHKLQQVIVLVKTLLDVERVSKRITESYNHREDTSDTKSTKDLFDMRNSTIKAINDIAADNGISARTKGEKKANALTAIMKEMLDVGVEEAKANLYSAKLSKSYNEVAAANAKALIDELNFTSDDYARMVAEQSETVAALRNQVESVTEQLRLKTIELKTREKEVISLQAKLKEVTENDNVDQQTDKKGSNGAKA